MEEAIKNWNGFVRKNYLRSVDLRIAFSKGIEVDGDLIENHLADETCPVGDFFHDKKTSQSIPFWSSNKNAALQLVSDFTFFDGQASKNRFDPYEKAMGWKIQWCCKECDGPEDGQCYKPCEGLKELWAPTFELGVCLAWLEEFGDRRPAWIEFDYEPFIYDNSTLMHRLIDNGVITSEEFPNNDTVRYHGVPSSGVFKELEEVLVKAGITFVRQTMPDINDEGIQVVYNPEEMKDEDYKFSGVDQRTVTECCQHCDAETEMPELLGRYRCECGNHIVNCAACTLLEEDPNCATCKIATMNDKGGIQ